MIKNIEFKKRDALLLENDSISAIVIPEIGGKLVSYVLKSKNFELVYQNKQQTYEKANLDSDFSEFDMSGFDDCFPSIAKEPIEYENETIMCPDHGEIWCSSFEYTIVGDNAVKLFMKSKIMPYTFEKTFSIDDNKLTIDFSIRNFGESTLTGFYTVHLLMNCNSDMRIFMPSCVTSVVNVLDSEILGKQKSIHDYPKCMDLNGHYYFLDAVKDQSAEKCEKYYASEPVKTGLCGAVYNKEGIKFTMQYDEEKLPYLGFWLNEGGYRNEYNCALEPSSAFYDSVKIARSNNKLSTIGAGENFDFAISLSLEQY